MNLSRCVVCPWRVMKEASASPAAPEDAPEDAPEEASLWPVMIMARTACQSFRSRSRARRENLGGSRSWSGTSMLMVSDKVFLRLDDDERHLGGGILLLESGMKTLLD